MTFRQIRIQCERFFYGDLGVLVQLFLLGVRGEEVRLDTIGPSQLSIGGRKVWIRVDGLLQQFDRAFVAFAILAAGVQLAAQIIVVRWGTLISNVGLVADRRAAKEAQVSNQPQCEHYENNESRREARFDQASPVHAPLRRSGVYR